MCSPLNNVMIIYVKIIKNDIIYIIMKISDVLKYILLFFVISYIFKKLNIKNLENDNIYKSNLIKKFLLHDDSLLNNTKPILWVHMNYENNCRKWESFGSRTSQELNQPYIQLCLKTIINNCKESFNIAVIDDTSFEILLQGDQENIVNVVEPIKSNITRKICFSKLIYKYGGFIVPNSIICFKIYFHYMIQI